MLIRSFLVLLHGVGSKRVSMWSWEFQVIMMQANRSATVLHAAVLSLWRSGSGSLGFCWILSRMFCLAEEASAASQDSVCSAWIHSAGMVVVQQGAPPPQSFTSGSDPLLTHQLLEPLVLVSRVSHHMDRGWLSVCVWVCVCSGGLPGSLSHLSAAGLR